MKTRHLIGPGEFKYGLHPNLAVSVLFSGFLWGCSSRPLLLGLPCPPLVLHLLLRSAFLSSTVFFSALSLSKVTFLVSPSSCLGVCVYACVHARAHARVRERQCQMQPKGTVGNGRREMAQTLLSIFWVHELRVNLTNTSHTAVFLNRK